MIFCLKRFLELRDSRLATLCAAKARSKRVGLKGKFFFCMGPRLGYGDLVDRGGNATSIGDDLSVLQLRYAEKFKVAQKRLRKMSRKHLKDRGNWPPRSGRMLICSTGISYKQGGLCFCFSLRKARQQSKEFTQFSSLPPELNLVVRRWVLNSVLKHLRLHLVCVCIQKHGVLNLRRRVGWVPKFCLCVFGGHSLWGRKTHKQNPPKIPGQSCENFVYVFFSLFFRSPFNEKKTSSGLRGP